MRLLPVVALLAFAPLLRADTPQSAEVEAITPIDSLPSTNVLAKAINGDPAERLQEIALTPRDDTSVDFGVQLRAIRTLPDYCPATGSCQAAIPYTTLKTLIQNYGHMQDLPTPRDILRLRAAIEALGIAGLSVGDPADVDFLGGYLNHQSRDVRATTAKTLGTLCLTRANTPLRTRFAVEQTDQVKLAISAALRDLSSCPGGM